MGKKFHQFAQEESPYFSSIIEIMCHSKKSIAEEFLCAINNVIDYILNTQPAEKNKINYQIIHIPNCPEWARPLLVRFIIHKAALTQNRILLDKIQKSIVNKDTITLNSNQGTNDYKKFIKRRTYYRDILKRFPNVPINNNKSLILVKTQDNSTTKIDKNPWIEDFFTENLTKEDYNLILTTDKSAYDLENDIRQLKNIPIIENIFLFHSSNRTRLTNSYNLNQIERLNKYGLGVKNCILFSFSSQPFRLYNTIFNVKNRLAGALMNKEIKRYDDFDGFITFTQEESDSFFKHSNTQLSIVVNPKEREVFTSNIDSILEPFPHNFRYKNVLSLTFSDELQELFLKDISNEIGYINPEIFSDFFNYYKHIWFENIKIKIDTFLNQTKSVAFIVPRETSKEVKQAIMRIFFIYKRQIQFCHIEDLKKGVNAEKIVVLEYRYTEKKYKTYPNSFENLPLKPGQKAFVIINRLTHNNYYEWNKHYYDKYLNGLLFSTFRKKKLGWCVRNYQKPLLPDIRDIIDEAEADTRKYQIEKCIVHYQGSKAKEYFAYERVLYFSENKYKILQLKDLSLKENIEIQILDELVEQIRTSLINKTIDNSKAEEYIRRDNKFDLTEEEINSPVELWKILLKSKVSKLGVETVYQSIFPTMKEISLKGFVRWCDFDYPMVLPKSRRSQNALLKYLGFDLGSPYHRIVLTKKMGNINTSRLLNSQIENLLHTIFTHPILSDKDFEELMDTNSDILSLLEIKNYKDVNTLISLLEISLKPVTHIEYDPD